MNTPTQEQRNKIDTAIDKIATLCTEDSSITPSQAVAKVASAMKLTPDYLPIIVRAYNTGAAAIHREDSNTLQEKVASYPIADIDEVYSILKTECPLNKKAEYVPPKDDFWKHDATYYWPDAWDYLKEKPDFSSWKCPEVKMAKCTDHKDSLNQDLVDTVHLTADEVTRIKYAAVDKLDKSIENLERELCKYGGVDLEDARQYAEISYGKEGVDMVNTLISANRLEKTARRKELLEDDHPFVKAFEDFAHNNELVKKAKKDEIDVIESCVNVLNPQVRPKDRYIGGMSEIDAMFKQGEEHRKKKLIKKAYKPESTNPYTGMTGLEMLNHPGWSGLDQYERELMYGLADPSHEANLRKIRVQTILTDLMNTDPYLKEKDPEEVIDAVNEILEVNPDLHKNKPMLRVALRQYMESDGMDIPTLGIISEFGKDERERRDRERTNRESLATQEGREVQRFRGEREKEERDEKFRRELAAAEEKLKRELADADIKAKADEGEKNRKAQKELDDARLKSQEEIARLSRESQEDIANENRWSQEGQERERMNLAKEKWNKEKSWGDYKEQRESEEWKKKKTEYDDKHNWGTSRENRESEKWDKDKEEQSWQRAYKEEELKRQKQMETDRATRENNAMEARILENQEKTRQEEYFRRQRDKYNYEMDSLRTSLQEAQKAIDDYTHKNPLATIPVNLTQARDSIRTKMDNKMNSFTKEPDAILDNSNPNDSISRQLNLPKNTSTLDDFIFNTP